MPKNTSPTPVKSGPKPTQKPDQKPAQRSESKPTPKLESKPAPKPHKTVRRKSRKLNGKIIKQKLLDFLDRRKHSVDENLRLAAIIPIIALIVGIFLPLVGLDARLSVINEATDSEPTPLIQPQQSVIEVSAGDFITHKQLRNFALWGQEIGGVSLLGINLYDVVTTPMPSYQNLNQVTSFLNSGALDFLTGAEFTSFCNDYLGDFGQSLIGLGQAVHSIGTQAGDFLTQLTSVLNQINASSEQLRNTISQVEGYLNLADNIVIVLFVIIAVAVVLFMFSFKRARFLPAIILSVMTAIFVIIGIAVLVGNSAIGNALQTSMADLSMMIKTMIDQLVPGSTSILNALFNIDSIKFLPQVSLFCGAGWWLITGSLASLTALAYLVPIFKRRRLEKVV